MPRISNKMQKRYWLRESWHDPKKKTRMGEEESISPLNWRLLGSLWVYQRAEVYFTEVAIIRPNRLVQYTLVTPASLFCRCSPFGYMEEIIKTWKMKSVFSLLINIKGTFKLILRVCTRHAQITQNSKFAISLKYLKKEVEWRFLHADRHEGLSQIDTMTFDGDGQAFPKVPK